jgi:hypothetical protein
MFPLQHVLVRAVRLTLHKPFPAGQARKVVVIVVNEERPAYWPLLEVCHQQAPLSTHHTTKF